MKIILLTKKTEYCKRIQDLVKAKFPDSLILEGEVGDTLPTIEWEKLIKEVKIVDCVISFLSPWIIPEIWLNKSKAAINFHPAPPNYPGTGCYNFAIYNKEKEYGATCHYMLPKVDTGKVIKVIRFPMYNEDTVVTLKNRTMENMLKLFCEVFEYIVNNKSLPEPAEQWTRRAYTRKDLQELCKITKEMNEEEVKLRIKATYFPGGKDLPYIELGGNKFVIVDNKLSRE